MVNPAPMASGSVLHRDRAVAISISSRIRNAAIALRRQASRVTPGRWFLALFAVLLLGFAVALLFQPAIGRGGR